jgi:hypothetical protein
MDISITTTQVSNSKRKKDLSSEDEVEYGNEIVPLYLVVRCVDKEMSFTKVNPFFIKSI